MKTKNSLSRRDFIKTGSVAAAGLMLGGISPLETFAAAKKPSAPTDRVRLACIGIGNRGDQIMGDFARTGLCDIVALCDVDLDARFCQRQLWCFCFYFL